MDYHLFQKDSQFVFSKKNQIKIKITKKGKNVMNFPLHCIVSYKVRIYPNFTTKVACSCIPKNHVDYIDSLHLNVQIF